MVESPTRTRWPRAPRAIQRSGRSGGALHADAHAVRPAESGTGTTGRAARRLAWSSYRATVGLAPVPAFLSVANALGLFGVADEATLQTRLARFVTQVPTDEQDDAMHRVRSNERVLGDKEFKDHLERGRAGPERGLTPTPLRGSERDQSEV